VDADRRLEALRSFDKLREELAFAYGKHLLAEDSTAVLSSHLLQSLVS